MAGLANDQFVLQTVLLHPKTLNLFDNLHARLRGVNARQRAETFMPAAGEETRRNVILEFLPVAFKIMPTLPSFKAETIYAGQKPHQNYRKFMVPGYMKLSNYEYYSQRSIH